MSQSNKPPQGTSNSGKSETMRQLIESDRERIMTRQEVLVNEREERGRWIPNSAYERAEYEWDNDAQCYVRRVK